MGVFCRRIGRCISQEPSEQVNAEEPTVTAGISHGYWNSAFG